MHFLPYHDAALEIEEIQRNRGTIFVVLHWPRRTADWERSGAQFLPFWGWMKTKSWKMSGGGRGQQVGTVRLTVIACAGYSHLSRKTILLFTSVQILMVVCCWLCSTAELALDGDNSCTIHVWFTHVAWNQCLIVAARQHLHWLGLSSFRWSLTVCSNQLKTERCDMCQWTMWILVDFAGWLRSSVPYSLFDWVVC